MSWRLMTLATLTLCMAAHAAAEPFVPASDDESLLAVETVPEPPLERARAWIVEARVTGQARLTTRAEALLDRESATLETRMLLAQIRQYNHDFEAARALLDQILEASPSHSQALLSRAFVRQATGDAAGAARDCAALRPVVETLAREACAARMQGLTGGLDEAAARLRSALAAPAEPNVKAWALQILAEIEHRRDRLASAHAALAEALALLPSAPQLLALEADLLIDQRRFAEAAEILADHRAIDALYLRWIIATKAQRLPVDSDVRALQARFAEAARRGDRRHLREEARLAIEVGDDAARAFALAAANFAVQREPEDARLLRTAAEAAGETTALVELDDWLRATGMQLGARIEG